MRVAAANYFPQEEVNCCGNSCSTCVVAPICTYRPSGRSADVWRHHKVPERTRSTG